jgi:competence protein ComEC
MQPVSPSHLEVTCLDVGQGDGILIRLPSGVNCMIDGGSTSESSVWDYRISQTAKYYGVRKIDWWFVSHSDQDHISGLVEFLEDYSTNLAGQNARGISLGHLVLPVTGEEDETLDTLRALAEKRGIEVHTMGTGDAAGASDGSWSLEALAPDAENLTGEKNQDSLVLRLRYGSFRMLFTGDLEKEGEQNLARSGIELQADVLKVGHHGSRYASSAGFLEKVAPQVAVISCGANNRYGHPAEETVERLGAAGSQMMCTAQEGSVQIWSDGVEYRVAGYVAAR